MSERIAVVLNQMNSGGIEAVVMSYYRNMDHSKVQFDFYLAEDSSFPQEEELRRLGGGICKIPAYTKVIPYQRALQNAFRERKYKVVHAHLSTMSVFPLFAAWRAGVPVRICHNHSTANWGEGKKTLLKYLLRPFNKLFANCWFACGEVAGRWMYGDKAFEAGKVTVMPNAIDVEKFRYEEEARTAIRQELGIDPNALVVGHVGRFTFAKNHKFLIELFRELRKTCPEARLVLIGEGELEQEVRDQVKKLNLEESVIFTGLRNDANRCYSAMDVFCLPSHYEGMVVVAWEAQANGLPCVMSDQISPEAARAKNAVQLSLSAPKDEWVKALTTLRRAPAAEIMDIREQAARFQKFYLEQCGNDRS